MITLRHPRHVNKTTTVTEKMAQYLIKRGWRRVSDKNYSIDNTGIVSDREGNVVADVSEALGIGTVETPTIAADDVRGEDGGSVAAPQEVEQADNRQAIVDEVKKRGRKPKNA